MERFARGTTCIKVNMCKHSIHTSRMLSGPSHTGSRTSQNLSKSMASQTHQNEKTRKVIRNAGFVVIRRFRALYKVRQNFNLVFEMKK